MYIKDIILEGDKPSGNKNVDASFQSVIQGSFAIQFSSFQSTRLSDFIREYNKVEKQTFKSAIKQYTQGISSNQRQIAVRDAWKWEKLSVKHGGRGTSIWNKSEIDQILTRKTHTVKGAEGHHLQNVAHHPELAGECDNIYFYRSRADHLKYGHGGDFHNESNKPLMNKESAVITEFQRNSLKREFFAAGAAAAFGFAVNSSITLIQDLSQNGLDRKSIKTALSHAGIEGSKGAFFGSGYYVTFRIGERAIENYAPSLFGNASKVTNFLKTNSGKMATIGGIIIAADSAYQIGRGLYRGDEFVDTLKNTAKKQFIPVSLLALSCYNIIAGGIASVLFIGYDVTSNILDQKTQKKLIIHKGKLLYDKFFKDC